MSRRPDGGARGALRWSATDARRSGRFARAACHHPVDRVAPPAAARARKRLDVRQLRGNVARPHDLGFGLEIFAGRNGDHGHIGQERHGETNELAGRRAEIERAGKRDACPREERGGLVRAFRGGARRALGGKLAPLSRLVLRQLREEVEVDEDLDLGAQDLGDDRRDHEVDRPERIAASRAHLVAVVRGDEDDGHVCRALPAADHRRRFQAVHPGHVDVEEDDRELVLQHLPQRFLAGSRRDEVLAELFQDRAIDDVLVGAIVDKQDVRPVLRQLVGLRGSRHRGQSADRRRAALNDGATPCSMPIISSVSTGFDR